MGIANAFNDFFGTIAQKTKDKIIESKKSFKDFLNTNMTDNSMFLRPTTETEILKAILDLKVSKASDPSSIPTSCFKMIAPIIGPLLSDIFNECITDGVFPSCLKIASIKPLHKKNSKLEVGNYRPISLLSNVGKLFEKILHKRLISFFDENNTIFRNQFGFRKGHNTTHAIIALTELVRESLDNNEFAAGVFIDLQKAFDTVDHKILLEKLYHYGIRGPPLRLLKSYLTDRSHYVSIKLANSSTRSIKHGVPQGSVLGPLLFLIYINDLNNAIKNSTTLHFADDTSLICQTKSLKALNKKINQDLSNLTEWLRANKISLNASKTEIIIFRNKTKVIKKILTLD